MKCPECSKNMIEEDFGGIKIDVCKDGCKGVWFDWLELKKLDEKAEGSGQALKKTLEAARPNTGKRGKINCPKCQIPMHEHRYQSSKAVIVDECYNCCGFFLDAGELKTIRNTFMNEEERQAYTEKLLNEFPGFSSAERDFKKDMIRSSAIDKLTQVLRILFE